MNHQSLRVAVIGSGPAAFFTAEALLGREGLEVSVDLYERLPAPFGLVRFGVAPDHQKIKSVTRSFDKVARKPGFRFFGNVDVGRQVSLDDLRRHYHAVCFATGAQTDRRLGIPGEDLARSHSATDFVAWYNGHPDYRNCTFDLSVERAAVIGVGNVAVDVARMLVRSPDELAKTDIADYALEALRQSRVREVVMLGRRGPVQAAFTNAELKELGELAGVDVSVRSDEIELDSASRAELDATEDRSLLRKIEILREFAARPAAGHGRRLGLRFLLSPAELGGDSRGQVARMRIVRNQLRLDDRGSLQAIPTSATEDLDVGIVFRSVGYRGVALPGVPFEERRGTVPHAAGRVLDPATGAPIPGLYVSGWLKRGPSGVIGTNKPDAAETVEAMLADAARGVGFQPESTDAAAAERLVRARRPSCISQADWRRIDELETARGRPAGRPRVKFTSAEEVQAALLGT